MIKLHAGVWSYRTTNLTSLSPGKYNSSGDAFSRICGAVSQPLQQLAHVHSSLCHLGITCLLHFVKTRNLPYSINDIKNITNQCKVCQELKPKFLRTSGTLIKATQPFQQLNTDFKGPLPSADGNKYFLTVIDEFSRFPFAFPCKNMESKDCY